MGCDQTCCDLATPYVYFNPRTPVECDNGTAKRYTKHVISIHAPQWGATGTSSPSVRRDKYFNPRTPVGCDRSSTVGGNPRQLFQSTHPSGVRLTEVSPSPIRSQFQSTHPSGVRLHHTPGRQIHLPISIHAPQWGATGTPLSRPPPGPYFNPRTPVGCDNKHYIGFIPLTGFQSTHPSGVRPRGLSSRNRLTAFQSTHPSGVRHFSYGGRDGDNQFQSTHPSGVRPITGIKPGSTSLFQSTHPSGVRLPEVAEALHQAHISIHAPQWGATPLA